MGTYRLCIRIEAKSGTAEPRYSGIEINMLPTSSLPISFEEGAKFDANTIGLALGLMWGTLLILLGLTATLTGIGTGLVEQLGSVHIGYKATILGTVIGGVCGLIYGFVLGAVVFRVYNMLFARDS